MDVAAGCGGPRASTADGRRSGAAKAPFAFAGGGERTDAAIRGGLDRRGGEKRLSPRASCKGNLGATDAPSATAGKDGFARAAAVGPVGAEPAEALTAFAYLARRASSAAVGFGAL